MRGQLADLLSIFSAVVGKSHDALAEEYKEKGYGTFKSAVADAVIAYLEPFQEEMNRFLEDKGQLLSILDDGAERSYKISHPKTVEASNKIGLYMHA